MIIEEQDMFTEDDLDEVGWYDDTEEFDEGYQAYMDGIGLGENPYLKGDQDSARYWNGGWRTAQEEHG